MNQPITMGEEVEQRGYCVVMLAIADLAHAIGRIPIGEWAYTFTTDPRYQLWVNGGSGPWQPEGVPVAIDRFYAYLEFNGWPAALVCPAGGSVTMPEDQLIAAFTIEVTAASRRKANR